MAFGLATQRRGNVIAFPGVNLDNLPTFRRAPQVPQEAPQAPQRPAAAAPASLVGPIPENLDRDTAIRRIKQALKKRSGREWSVTGGRGTGWGWIAIRSIKKYASNEYGNLVAADQAFLANLLRLDRVDSSGVSIPASSDYWREYIDRAEGREPRVTGRPYWD